MISCYIIDDEQHFVDILKEYIQQTPYLQLAGSSTKPFDGIAEITSSGVQLVFLDIHMPEVSGISLLKILNLNNNKVILTTAYSKYAIEGFENDVIDYLLKPITYQRFLKASHKALKLFQMESNPAPVKAVPEVTVSPESDYIFVKGEFKGKHIKINYADVDYIEGLKNYVAFHCGREKTVALMNMKTLETKLPSRLFYRIHNSYIVALDKIVAIEGNQVVLRSKETTPISLPIGVTYKSEFLEYLKVT